MYRNKLLIIGVIAFREAKFWSNVLSNSSFSNINIIFISYCSISTKYLTKSGYKVFCIYTSTVDNDKHSFNNRSPDDPVFLHESLTFLESRKSVFSKYNRLCNKIYNFLYPYLIESNISFESVFVFQELGAFAPVLALYDISLSLKINHYFLEPSIIPNHTFLLHNTFKFRPIKSLLKSNRAPEFEKFCSQLFNTTPIAFKDIVNLKSNSLNSFSSQLYRLINKLSILLSVSDHTYYDAILPSILQRIYRAISERLAIILLPKFSDNILSFKSYVYYPLHSDIDFALTVRNPAYLDQYKNLLNILKSNTVVIKQHPTRAYTFKIINLLRLCIHNIKSKNKVYLANSSINSITLSSKSLFTYFITSKAGIFAELMNYKTKSPIPLPFSSLTPSKTYFDILDKSFPFDLYDNSESNVNFTRESLSLILNNVRK